MPFAFIIAGLVLLTASVRGTQDELYSLIAGDFKGKDSFLYWMLAIFIIGSVGYIPKFKPISSMFLVLVVLVMILARGGFFAKFTDAVDTVTGKASPVFSNVPLTGLPGLSLPGLQTPSILRG